MLYMILHELVTVIQQAPTDSVAVAIGTVVGSVLGAKLALVLGAVNKFLVTLALKIVGAQDKAPSWLKALIALGFAEGTTALAGFLAAHHLPVLSPDLAQLPVFVTGLVVWAVSMGWHSLLTKLNLVQN